jgi:hypothetical protein
MGGAPELGEAVQPPAAPHDGSVTPVVLTVHGTNDADTSDEGERWRQRGSVFALWLATERPIAVSTTSRYGLCTGRAPIRTMTGYWARKVWRNQSPLWPEQTGLS